MDISHTYYGLQAITNKPLTSFARLEQVRWPTRADPEKQGRPELVDESYPGLHLERTGLRQNEDYAFGLYRGYGQQAWADRVPIHEDFREPTVEQDMLYPGLYDPRCGGPVQWLLIEAAEKEEYINIEVRCAHSFVCCTPDAASVHTSTQTRRHSHIMALSIHR